MIGRRGFITGLIVLAIAGSAHAECLQWGVVVNSGTRVCVMNDAVNRDPVIPESRVVPRAGEPTISSYRPECETGWSLVHDGSRPMCAKELREPR